MAVWGGDWLSNPIIKRGATVRITNARSTARVRSRAIIKSSATPKLQFQFGISLLGMKPQGLAAIVTEQLDAIKKAVRERRIAVE
jgi:hypothetical protein